MRGNRWRRLLSLGEPEVDDEIEAHIAMQIEELVAAGWSEAAAREEALRRFGDRARVTREVARIDRAQEASRRRLQALAGLGQDLRLALRTLRHRPLFALAAIGVIALGVGANTAVFAVVDAALVRPLPFADADRLVYLRDVQGVERGLPASFPELLDWQREADFLDGVIGLYGGGMRIRNGEGWELVDDVLVAGDPARTVGVTPIVGRWFTREEIASGARVVVLDERTWRERFGGRPDVVGSSLALGTGPHTVVGVVPAQAALLRASGTQRTALWLPAVRDESMTRDLHFITVVGRLRDGVSLGQARAAAEVLASRLRASEATEHGVELQPARDVLIGGSRPILWVLAGAAIFLLLLVCANLASLFLSKLLERSRELAVRVALGAGRGRLVRLVLTECLVVGLLGGVAGLGLFQVIIGLTSAAARRAGALAPSSGADARVVAITLATAMLASVAFGLWSALRATRVDPAAALRQGSLGAAGGATLRKLLVGVQVAVGVVLLAGTGLLLRSLGAMLAEDPGFEARGVVAARVLLADTKYDDDARVAAFLEELVHRAAALPGVTAAGLGSQVPLEASDTNGSFDIVGREVPESQQPQAKKRVVGPGYFETLRIPLLAGRTFRDADRAGAPDVVIISDALRRRFWPNEDPVGKRLHFSWGPGDVQEIVGVVGDVRHDGLDQPVEGMMYRPVAQFPRRGPQLVVRGDPTTVAPALRRIVQSMDSSTVVHDVRTLDSVVSESTASRRTLILLLGGFSVMALVLAALGMYSVIALVVARRTREIGIRLAVGAQRRDILRLVLGEAAGVVVVGVVVGVAVALAAAQAAQAMLYRVSAADPVTFGAVAGLLGGIALVAAYVPARRAARMDPLSALRTE